ncbi:major facilitator superfamily MFS_1, partial [mine drainage metagenome]
LTLGALGNLGPAGEATLVLVGSGLLVAFVALETRVPHPMFRLALFRNRAFAAGNLAILLNALARGAFTFVMVFYLQGPPLFLSPITAGLFLIPVSISLASVGPVSGFLSDRYGARLFATTGLLVSAVGFLWLTTIGPGVPFVELLGPFVLVGVGMGLFASPNRASIMNAVPPESRGVASGISTTLVNASTTFSLALAILVISSVMGRPQVEAIFLGTGVHGQYPPALIASFVDSIHRVFFVSTGLLLLALLPSALRGPIGPGGGGRPAGD